MLSYSLAENSSPSVYCLAEYLFQHTSDNKNMCRSTSGWIHLLSSRLSLLVKGLTILLAEFPFQSSLSEKCLLTAYFSCQLTKCLAECPFQHAKCIFLYFCLAEFPFQSRSLREVLAEHIFQLLKCYVLLNTRFSRDNALISFIGAVPITEDYVLKL